MEKRIDFGVVRRAGLNATEFGLLADVSRVTVSLWLNGHTQPHHLHRKRIAKLLKVLLLAVRAGDLPLTTDVERAVRMPTTKKIVQRHMTELEEAAKK